MGSTVNTPGMDQALADLEKIFLPVIKTEYAPTREEWAEICEGIWIGALEGGSNYWIDYIHTKGHDLKCGYTVVDKNFDIVIHIDGEEDEIPTYRKAFDVIVEGLNRLDPMRQNLAYTDLGQLDANDYDYIIQLGVFGKEVYC